VERAAGFHLDVVAVDLLDGEGGRGVAHGAALVGAAPRTGGK
jgi:hypothetical protein